MINESKIDNKIHKDFREFVLRKTLNKTMEIRFENPSLVFSWAVKINVRNISPIFVVVKDFCVH